MLKENKSIYTNVHYVFDNILTGSQHFKNAGYKITSDILYCEFTMNWLIDQQAFPQNKKKLLNFYFFLLFFSADEICLNWEDQDSSCTDVKALGLILAGDPSSVSIP